MLIYQPPKSWCLLYDRKSLIGAFMQQSKCSYKHINCEVMKIVLKHNDQLKLYADQLTLNHILTFIQTEFHLDRHSLALTFQDLEGDDITILTDDDFNIMQAILDGKEYVRINVEGVKAGSRPCSDKLISVSQPHKQVEELQINDKAEKVQELSPMEVQLSYSTMAKQVDQEEANEQKRKKEARKEELPVQKQPENINEKEDQANEKCKWSGKKQKACQMKQFMSEMVANLVDERIKALLPCLREQIMKESKREEKLYEKLVHQGFECKGCSVTPIAGIRYECPKCPNFNLCQVCQTKIEHDHNLLKIKKIEPKQKACEMPCLRQCFGGAFRGYHGHHKRQGFQKGREECGRWSGPHHMMRKLRGLSFIFGNDPESYRSFVEENKFLKPRETFMKYAQMTGMPEAEFKQKFIALRCHKLSETFGKPAQTYKSFVQENYQLGLKELMKVLYEKGIEKMSDHCGWKGKCYNFNTFNNEEKQKRKQECEKEEPQQNEELYIAGEEGKSNDAKDSTQANKAKGLLFMAIKKMYPAAENKTVYKFVDLHYKNQKFEEVVNLWIEKNTEK